MQTDTITLSTPDGPMPTYEARPTDRRGAIIVIQEAFGVNEHIEDVCRRFASADYLAVPPALFHRTSTEPIAYDDFPAALALIGAMTDEGILADVDAALDRCHREGFDDVRTGVVGFCMGGRVTFLVALRRALGAAVGFYGGGIVTARMPHLPALVGEVGDLRTPWLGLFGDEDGSIPVDDVEHLRAELDAHAPVAHDVVRYPGAGHGFFCDLRDSFAPEAAEDAWGRAVSWFATHLA